MTNTQWSIPETIKLLELFTKNELWDNRANELQNEFGKNHNPGFFTVQTCKRELHRVFSQPNPEHVNGLPTHPRSKEAAELWLQHYQKELVKKNEIAKQMIRISMRKNLDLVLRFKTGKISDEEIFSMLEHQRRIDSERPNASIFETNVQKAISQSKADDLDKVSNMGDLLKVIRGISIDTPIQSPIRSPIKDIASPPPPPRIASPIKGGSPKNIASPKGQMDIKSPKTTPIYENIKSPTQKPSNSPLRNKSTEIVVVENVPGSSPTHSRSPIPPPPTSSPLSTRLRSPRGVKSPLNGGISPRGENSPLNIGISAGSTPVAAKSPPNIKFSPPPVPVSSPATPYQVVARPLTSIAGGTAVQQRGVVNNNNNKIVPTIRTRGAKSPTKVVGDIQEVSVEQPPNEAEKSDKDIMILSPVKESSPKKILLRSDDLKAQKAKLKPTNINASSSLLSNKRPIIAIKKPILVGCEEKTSNSDSANLTIKENDLADNELLLLSNKIATKIPKVELPDESLDLKDETVANSVTRKRRAGKMDVEKGPMGTFPTTINTVLTETGKIKRRCNEVCSSSSSQTSMLSPTASSSLVSIEDGEIVEDGPPSTNLRRSHGLHSEATKAKVIEPSNNEQPMDTTTIETKPLDKSDSIKISASRKSSISEPTNRRISSRIQDQHKVVEKSTKISDAEKIPTKILSEPIEETTKEIKEEKIQIEESHSEIPGRNHRTLADSGAKKETKSSDSGKVRTSTEWSGRKEIKYSESRKSEEVKFAEGRICMATQTRLWIRNSRKRSNRVVLPPKSSSRSSRASTQKVSSNCGTQTGRVQFEPDDVLILNKPLNEVAHIKLIQLSDDERGSSKKSKRPHQCVSDADTKAQINSENLAVRKRERENRFRNIKRSSTWSKFEPNSLQVLTYTGNETYEEIEASLKGTLSKVSLDIDRKADRSGQSNSSTHSSLRTRRSWEESSSNRRSTTTTSSIMNANRSSTEIISRSTLLQCWKEISQLKHSNIFMHSVADEDVPGYHDIVLRSTDLSKIRGEIESEKIRTYGQFTSALSRMFGNALMFNCTGHTVNNNAREMFALAMHIINVSGKFLPLSFKGAMPDNLYQCPSDQKTPSRSRNYESFLAPSHRSSAHRNNMSSSSSSSKTPSNNYLVHSNTSSSISTRSIITTKPLAEFSAGDFDESAAKKRQIFKRNPSKNEIKRVFASTNEMLNDTAE